MFFLYKYNYKYRYKHKHKLKCIYIIYISNVYSYSHFIQIKQIILHLKLNIRIIK